MERSTSNPFSTSTQTSTEKEKENSTSSEISLSEEPQEILYYSNKPDGTPRFNSISNLSSPLTPNQPSSRFSWDEKTLTSTSASTSGQALNSEDWLARVRSLDEFFGASPNLNASGSGDGKPTTPHSTNLMKEKSKKSLDDSNGFGLEEMMKKVRTPEWKGWRFDDHKSSARDGFAGVGSGNHRIGER